MLNTARADTDSDANCDSDSDPNADPSSQNIEAIAAFYEFEQRKVGGLHRAVESLSRASSACWP